MRLRVGGLHHERGANYERLDAAQAHRVAENLQGFEEGRQVGAVHQFHGDERAQAVRLAGVHLRLVLAVRTRVEHALHGGVRLQVVDDLDGVLLLLGQAQLEGLDLLQQAVGVGGRKHCAGNHLQVPEALGERVIVGCGDASEQVGVATQVLGGGLHADVCAQVEGLLQ